MRVFGANITCSFISLFAENVKLEPRQKKKDVG